MSNFPLIFQNLIFGFDSPLLRSRGDGAWQATCLGGQYPTIFELQNEVIFLS